ncbi:MAG TPA: serine hydrolase [Bacteroidota bacterium]|nr:serine hydrolase [Bacteroidota bacterium]
MTKRFTITIFSVLLLCLCAANTHAQSKAVQIDTLIHQLARRGQFSGSILVAEQGSVIYKNAFGTADAENLTTFTPSTPCYLASLSKAFTAMAIMMLKERAKLQYTDPIAGYFPRFPAYANKVTIRELLNHTSGIPDYVGLGLERPGLTNAQVLFELALRDSLDFPPGTQFSYSNSGYVLLASIVEKVTKEPYAKFLKDNIFDPLGMKNTIVYDETKPDISNRARGYDRFGNDDDYNLLTYGEGGIYSSVEDMFLWDQALYGEALVKKATLQEAFTGAALNDSAMSSYGFGWAIGTYDGQPTISHAGRYGGFNTYIKRYPQSHNTVIFLTNHGFRNMGLIGNAIANILEGKTYELPKRSIAEAMFARFRKAGIDSALSTYYVLKPDPEYDTEESELNELGYELMGMKNVADAIPVLKLNAKLFPASWNVYDGLGEAYMKNGNRDLAIQNYKKSLELNPKNMNAVQMLKKMGAK